MASGMSGRAPVAPARDPVHHHLRQVGDHRQAAVHVAVQRAVAHRHLGLVPGGQQQRAVLVGKRHQQVAADARLDVLLGHIARQARGRRPPARRRSVSMMPAIGSVSVWMPRLRASSTRIVHAAAARVTATASSRRARFRRPGHRRRSRPSAPNRCRRKGPAAPCGSRVFRA